MESSDNYVSAQGSQEPPEQPVEPESLRHTRQPEKELSHQGSGFVGKNHSEENEDIDQLPKDKRDEKNERPGKEDQSDEGDESSSSSADKELPKQEEATPVVDTEKQVNMTAMKLRDCVNIKIVHFYANCFPKNAFSNL